MSDERDVYRTVRDVLRTAGLSEPACRHWVGRITNLLSKKFRITRSEVPIHEGLWKDTRRLMQEIFTNEELSELPLDERASYATDYLFGGLEDKYEFLVKANWYEAAEEDPY